ncbi:dephospho-CoA kinase [Reinekea thalattae]|uniref:Dephospho-CoA kinase n=1 Tax=Reinekea thalattae TaxID=2593301 RepID=A0A5C8Z376_9GAMM|nr:dephospho-CoA kinase [Reinekea thalattae]TXR52007.1 dephospho-CoA kinase [Reinekea thalattae]
MIVGLTGGIGSGKSSLAELLVAEGVHRVDADLVARQVVAPESPALAKIAQHFGDDILIDGELNRAKLRQLVFSHAEHKQWLDNLLHPIIREEILRQLALGQSPYQLLEAPLLFENNLDSYCEKTVLVDLPVELQLERAASRDESSHQQIQAIIDAQMSRTEKQQRADIIIDNALDRSHLEKQAKQLHLQLSALANKR